ncbi:HlyD family secretion protein [Francisella sciaenopsi]|uniref:Efflux RND transporter periplasmic adaptor subunit n=1 Tax=Francisella sciaenopsi TaxID=3055034 RepID=A0ABQ6PE36_9GAMM
MNKFKKIIILSTILIIIILSGVLYYFFQPDQKVIPGYVSTNIRYIASEESGKLLQLNVTEGQSVDKGTLLYSLDSKRKLSKNEVSASANIVGANADLEYAKDQYLRQKELLKYQGTSKKDYQSAYANYIKAKARVDSATVKSIEKAYVYQIYYRPGEIVGAYNPVLSLINPNDVYVVFYVSKYDINKIHLGDELNISTDTGSSTTAIVKYISKDAEYTPPLLYGINADSEISFEVKANINYKADESNIHVGEPVRIVL